MKNVTSRKLIIDRSKAPEKLGTLKDISLYGSFVSIFWPVGCQIIGRDWKRTEEDPRTTPILSNPSRQIGMISPFHLTTLPNQISTKQITV